MQNLAENIDVRTPAVTRTAPGFDVFSGTADLPLTIIIPVKNEAANLSRCLDALRGAGEVYVIDSRSDDKTVEIAQSFGAQVVQFHYNGGWPKKRQWALDSLPLTFDWVLLLDADEIVTPQLAKEIRHVISDPRWLLSKAPDAFSGAPVATRRRQLQEAFSVPTRKGAI